ncbi:L,D-transpeptidase [Lactobacillus xylocopicola]|uniref:Cell surface protein n=1 Tax=Lactobacillus xylocopicola TaxID=2976676 RepID=A0ABM8BHJ8_9LACO|nr:L,D-transpeptidase [Lactobacillus xylocopicola]BDR60774.1 cell surface protein [Lactobacillus xylocopicola]
MKKGPLKSLTIFFILIICVVSLARVYMPHSTKEAGKHEAEQKTVMKKTAASYRPYQDPASLRKPYDWHKPSQTTPYPKLKRLENDLSIRVSLKGNRVYILRDHERVYTMLASSGVFKKGKSLTPTGTFKIRYDRGAAFYNPNLNEGASNWVSWDEQNVYLFHSVPTKSNGQYHKKEAQKLGVKPASHGCIRLSVADSNWLVEHIPAGTEVIIKNK